MRLGGPGADALHVLCGQENNPEMNNMEQNTSAKSGKAGALLAFCVSADCAEASVLVWAPTRAKAKSIGMGSEWLEGCDWNDIQAKREPKADGLRSEPGRISDAPTKAEYRIMRDLEWHQIEGGQTPCVKCDKYPWDELPESWLGEDDVCAECAKANTVSKGG